MSRAVAVLDALAQETRLAIFRLLVSQGPQGAPAGRIAEEMGLHCATLSFHLSGLRNAGLIVAERRGRSIIYTADFRRMAELIAYLTENCCSAPAADRRGARFPANRTQPEGALS